MKCPACSADFPHTWKLYLAAPLGRFPCPRCGTGLASKHHWWYWPMVMLGCSVCGIPLALLAWYCIGGKAAIVAGVIGGLTSGLPIDKHLEGRYTILTVRNKPAPVR